MSNSGGPGGGSLRPRLAVAAGVIIVNSVMFTFISFWRTAAIVLCDLGSTAFYIGGIVEQFIGPAAPWFILAVMFFSFAVSLVYIESCTLFVRGGVYRVVRGAMGGLAAKVSVSALLFDYILTGPISSVSAGQYITGLLLESLSYFAGFHFEPDTRLALRSWGSVAIAILVTIYFFRQNLRGIHESSDKALKIMAITTVMGVVILVWGGLTLYLHGPRNAVPLTPDLTPQVTSSGAPMPSSLGFLEGTSLGDVLGNLEGRQFLGLMGVIGIVIAFGHSVLAMSGLETLAQVYREVESPKLKNFKKAALLVFLYSLLFTGGVSFLAVLLIPGDVRMTKYAENLIGGLAMSVAGPVWAQLLLNAFVVIVGFLILSGAVNTAIIGSNGVLNRVAEDGVVPDWFRKPHPRYGTTHRVLLLILILQLVTILASRGDVIVLGEAYAFGVVWSFTLMTASMLILRFKDRTPREFKVPLNLRLGSIELPIGLACVFLILFFVAIANLLTKETATKWGLGFTASFLVVFLATEYFNERRRRGRKHEHLEQFNQETTESLSAQQLGLTKPYRKVVAIRSPNSMYMLEKSLAETDPMTTDLIVMTAKVALADDTTTNIAPELSDYDQQLMTAVVQKAELAGKQVQPLIVPTNNPLHAVLKTVSEIKAQEVVLGASNKYTAEEQLDQVALYWLSMHAGEPAPVTVRVLSRNRDLYFDLDGGNRIPKISERQARSVAELRAAGVGVDQVLLVHDGTAASHDLFQSVLTMLDPLVGLTLVDIEPLPPEAVDGQGICRQEQERAEKLRRELDVTRIEGDLGPGLVELIQKDHYDLLIAALPEQPPADSDVPWEPWTEYVLAHAPCRVLLAPAQIIPSVTDD